MKAMMTLLLPRTELAVVCDLCTRCQQQSYYSNRAGRVAEEACGCIGNVSASASPTNSFAAMPGLANDHLSFSLKAFNCLMTLCMSACVSL
jgi:hypothetical protein